jgi:hypothetical protein
MRRQIAGGRMAGEGTIEKWSFGQRISNLLRIAQRSRICQIWNWRDFSEILRSPIWTLDCIQCVDETSAFERNLVSNPVLDHPLRMLSAMHPTKVPAGRQRFRVADSSALAFMEASDWPFATAAQQLRPLRSLATSTDVGWPGAAGKGVAKQPTSAYADSCVRECGVGTRLP